MALNNRFRDADILQLQNPLQKVEENDKIYRDKINELHSQFD